MAVDQVLVVLAWQIVRMAGDSHDCVELVD